MNGSSATNEEDQNKMKPKLRKIKVNFIDFTTQNISHSTHEPTNPNKDNSPYRIDKNTSRINEQYEIIEIEKESEQRENEFINTNNKKRKDRDSSDSEDESIDARNRNRDDYKEENLRKKKLQS